MNKIRFLMVLSFAAVFLLFASCNKECKIKYPKDLKSIDWENYNDVYDVIWNYKKKCSDKNNDIGRDIKVCGWIFQGPEGYYQLDPTDFRLCNKEKNIFDHNPYENGTAIYIRTYPWHPDINDESFRDSLKIKFATSDITKKCYINGKLNINSYPTNDCCTTSPEILINSANDIYFK